MVDKLKKITKYKKQAGVHLLSISNGGFRYTTTQECYVDNEMQKHIQRVQIMTKLNTNTITHKQHKYDPTVRNTAIPANSFEIAHGDHTERRKDHRTITGRPHGAHETFNAVRTTESANNMLGMFHSVNTRQR